ncbi:MAG: DeoR/GlpR family DNA-binding transcription regulator [Victivallaceae bacterium]|nr:DeoR/GlpR family DNA-binding transcription regulator [Victivallaceae bacterium]
MNDRQKRILENLQRGRIDLKTTAAAFGVTEMTLRRDFRELEARRLLVQVRGGAIAAPVRYEPERGPFPLNDVKRRIAEALYRRIMPCRSIFLGAGSTSFAFAKLIAGKHLPELSIIINSLPAASTLFRSASRVILLGGELRSDSLDLIGPVAEKNIEEYRVDYLVSGCDGALIEDGFYTSDIGLCHLEKNQSRSRKKSRSPRKAENSAEDLLCGLPVPRTSICW